MRQPNSQNPRQPAMGFVMLVVLIDLLAVGLMIPVLPLLVGEFVNGKDEQAYWFGVASALFGISSFFGGPIWGALSDRFGRRPILLIGFLGLAASFFLTGAATSLWMLLLARVISGGMQANMAVANAYVADITPPDQRAAQFGKLGAMFGIGFILGPLVGGVLGEYSLRYPLYLAGGLALLNWLYGVWVLPESLPLDKREPFRWRKANPIAAFVRLNGLGPVRWVVLALALNLLAQFMLHTTWVLYTHFRLGWGTQTVGWSLAIVGVTAAIGQGLLVKPVVAKLGRRRAAILAMSSGFFALIGYGLATVTWVVFALIAANVLSHVSGPAINSLVSEAAHPSEQGKVLGALSSIQSLMLLIAPVVAAPMLVYIARLPASAFMAGLPYFACALIQGSAIALLIWSFSRFETKIQPEPAANA